jgi:hypothetical protein
MNAAGPIIKQLDHVIVRVDDPQSLFKLFSETFGLPVAWPLKSHPVFTSGGIVLGNVNLEILRVGRAPVPSSNGPTGAARFCALAFEVGEAGEADSLTDIVRELGGRGIPHTPVLPYVQKQADGRKVTLWFNVMLGKLLGRNFWVDANLLLSRLPGSTALANAGAGGRLMAMSMDRMFAASIVFLVQYAYGNFVEMPHWSEFENHDEKRASDLAQLRARDGGALGLESVKEIVACVTNFAEARELWNKLCAPLAESSPAVWEVADSPAVRLVPASENVIRTLVLKVASLPRAETFLREKGMLGVVTEEQITLAPAAIHGLDIRLVQ